MNMFKDLIGSLGHTSIFGIVGTVFMFLFFMIIIIWALKLDKKYVETMSHLPLESFNHTKIEDNHD